jgi:hypothetical protein
MQVGGLLHKSFLANLKGRFACAGVPVYCCPSWIITMAMKMHYLATRQMAMRGSWSWISRPLL